MFPHLRVSLYSTVDLLRSCQQIDGADPRGPKLQDWIQEGDVDLMTAA